MTEMSGDNWFSVSLLETLLLADIPASFFVKPFLHLRPSMNCSCIYRALSNPAQNHLKMVYVSLNTLRYLGLELRDKKLSYFAVLVITEISTLINLRPVSISVLFSYTFNVHFFFFLFRHVVLVSYCTLPCF